MILPPFFGSQSSENLRDKSWYRMRHSYLSKDVLFYQIPSKNLLQSYIAIDTLLYDMPPVGAGSTLLSYVNFDTLLYNIPDKKVFNSYLNFDALYYNPPPEAPEPPYNVFALAGDSDADLSWSKPYNNRSPITDYDIQYSISGLGGFGTWEHFDDPVSTGTGVYIDQLINGTNYKFRVAAINSIGTGEYGYSNIISPSPGDSSYCKMMVYLPLNNTVNNNIIDDSCIAATVNSFSQTSSNLYIDTETHKYGNGSLFLDGQPYVDSVLYGDQYYSINTCPHLAIGYDQNINWNFSGDFTIEMFIKPLTSTGYGTLFSIQNVYYAEDNYNNIRLYRSNNSMVFDFNLNYAIGEDYVYDTKQITANNINLSTTNWTHLAIVRYSNTIKLYINGIFSGNTVVSNTNLNLSGFPIFIGSHFGMGFPGAASDGFGGYIDQIIVSRAARYKSNFTPSEYTLEKECNC